MNVNDKIKPIKNPFDAPKPKEILVPLSEQEIQIFFELLGDFAITKIGRPIQDKLINILEAYKREIKKENEQ